MFVFRSDRLPGELLFTASSLESNEAFWHLPPHHPANTSTALLQSAPFIFFHFLLLRHTLTSTHTQSQTNIHMHTQAQREITCPTQAANKGSVKRMCCVVAFVYAHCLGFCLVAFLLYPSTKRRKSLARKTGLHLGFF